MRSSDRFIQKAFEKRIKRTESCWYFTKLNGEVIHDYPKFMWKGVSVHACRVSYLMYHGDVPDGMKLHRSCGNGGCINPEHIEAISDRELALRVVDKGRNPWSMKTHCLRGHEFNEQNTRVRMVNGRPNRSCKACTKVVLSSRSQS